MFTFFFNEVTICSSILEQEYTNKHRLNRLLLLHDFGQFMNIIPSTSNQIILSDIGALDNFVRSLLSDPQFYQQLHKITLAPRQ